MKKFPLHHVLKSKTRSASGVSALLSAGRVHATENNTLKVGLIGCGGRGRGAVADTLTADPNTELVAVADAFCNNAEAAVEGLSEQFETRINVGPDRVFSGLDSFKDVIPLCDVVLLCEPPGFRPRSLRCAVEAGKHVFCEKPVAADVSGVRSVMESSEIAKKNGTTIVSGLCWRYDPYVSDMVSRVKNGQIGNIVSGRLLYLNSQPWRRPCKENDTEMMFQVRDWYNFCWLSGDFNVEQHVHTIDKALWVMDDIVPDTILGLGARMQFTERENGDIYDSMASCFEYANGVAFYSYCRRQDNGWMKIEAIIAGSKGTADLLSGIIRDYNGNVLYQQEKEPSDHYLIEHQKMYEAIRSGNVINNGDYMAKATMMGIASRMACYSGARLSWTEALASEYSMAPSGYTWNDTPWNMPDEKGRYLVPVPGEGRRIHGIVRS